MPYYAPFYPIQVEVIDFVNSTEAYENRTANIIVHSLSFPFF
jgi:hypothetical protein